MVSTLSKSLFVSLVAFASVAPAHADALSIGSPTYGGSGCAAGSVSSIFSPDEGSLSLLFDDYVVDAGPGESKDRKSCALTVPVTTDAGFRIQSITIDYRGYIEAPFLAWITFLARYKINGDDALDPILKAWPHNFEEDFTIRHTILGPKPWQQFPCGGTFDLTARTEFTAKKWIKWGAAFAALDSADVAPTMEIGVSVVPCQ